MINLEGTTTKSNIYEQKEGWLTIESEDFGLM